MGLFSFAREALIPEDEARSLLLPYQQKLTDVWVKSMRDWKSVPPELRFRLSETAFVPPTNLFGFAQSHAREQFRPEDDSDIEWCELPNVFGFYIKKKLLVRFNALSRDHLVKTVTRTDHRQRYYNQEPIPGLVNSATRLTVGYTLDPSKTEIASIGASVQLGETLVYFFSLEPGEDMVLPVTVPSVPPTPTLPESTTQRKRRKPS